MLHTRDAGMNSSHFLAGKRCAIIQATGSTQDGDTWKHFLRFIRTLNVPHRASSGHGTDRLLFLSQATGPCSSSPDEWKTGGFSESLKDSNQARSLTESLCSILFICSNFMENITHPGWFAFSVSSSWWAVAYLIQTGLTISCYPNAPTLMKLGDSCQVHRKPL